MEDKTYTEYGFVEYTSDNGESVVGLCPITYNKEGEPISFKKRPMTISSSFPDEEETENLSHPDKVVWLLIQVQAAQAKRVITESVFQKYLH